MRRERVQSARLTVGILLGLLSACGGGGGDGAPVVVTPVPTPTAAPAPAGSGTLITSISDPACTLQYSEPVSASLVGTDPQLLQQWHLKNDGTVTGNLGEDLDVQPAWIRTQGTGVRVAVIDDAIEVTHQDLYPNVVPGASYNYRQNGRGNAWPLPCSNADGHGTSVTGLIAARDGNALGGSGVAPRASLVGYNALATGSDADVTEALNRALDSNSIYNNSWGSPDDGFLHQAEASFIEAIDRGITTGRSGKGAIYVFPAGNGGCYNPELHTDAELNGGAAPTPCVRENSNYDGYVNKLGVITACAVSSEGQQPFYGERGANMLVCAPSSDLDNNDGVRTTAIQNGYRNDFTGTSASTPMVSGVVALLLAANPSLSWRDVRLILAESARKNSPLDSDWSDHFGLSFNHKFGFGVSDANAALQLAQTWTSVGGSATLQKCGPYTQSPNAPLPDPVSSVPQPVDSTISASACTTINQIEFVEVRFTATSTGGSAATADHPSTGDLRIRLTSPQGLVSELADQHICYNASNQAVNCGQYNQFQFGSVRHLNEPVVHAGNGNWTLQVTDMLSQDQGQFANWSLTFYGR